VLPFARASRPREWSKGEEMQLLVLIFLLLAQEGTSPVRHAARCWGPTPTHRNDVTLVLEWDGKNITGLINPGPESIKLAKATLEPSSDPGKWTVHSKPMLRTTMESRSIS
jgi:hypothetical protein